MNPTDYLDPTSSHPVDLGVTKKATLYQKIKFFTAGKPFPQVNPGDVVILGIPESRNSANPSASQAPEKIRGYLYGLGAFSAKGQIVDAGNLKATKSPTETYAATRDLIDFFVEMNATVLVIGGTQELTASIYQAVKRHRSLIGVAIVDSHLDMDEDDGDFSSTSYISTLLKEPLPNLLNVSVIGYQGYFVNAKDQEAFTSRNHELLRLGFVRGNYREVEPSFRNADIASFDIKAIRNADCPGNIYASPNGLYAEEACQLARYAGLSDRICCFGLFEHSPSNDPSGQSAHISAQLVWHFLEAHSQRRDEYPYHRARELKKFIVNSGTPDAELVFYRNQATDSWWLEIPANPDLNLPDNKHIMACSYNDYLIAGRQEIPDRWIKAYQKLW